jgi:hypothetical protein
MVQPQFRMEACLTITKSHLVRTRPCASSEAHGFFVRSASIRTYPGRPPGSPLAVLSTDRVSFKGVVWKLDRLGRSLQHLLSILDDLSGWGVDFTSLRDAGMDTTTPSGRLMLQLLGAFAEFERALIQEGVIAGVRRAQANGIHCGRPKVEIDLRPAVAMLEKGHGLGVTAKAMGVARSTLRRRLLEAWGFRS